MNRAAAAGVVALVGGVGIYRGWHRPAAPHPEPTKELVTQQPPTSAPTSAVAAAARAKREERLAETPPHLRDPKGPVVPPDAAVMQPPPQHVPLGPAGAVTATGAAPAASLRVCASHPLDVKAEAVTRAVMVIHGNRRDPDYYYANTRQAAEAAGAWGPGLALVAPWFEIEEDASPPGVARWIDNDAWKAGTPYSSLGAAETETVAASESRTNGSAKGEGGAAARASAFDAVDAVVSRMCEAFPRLEHVTVTGHSAGAQMTQRLAMGSDWAALEACRSRKTPDGAPAPPLRSRFVIGNPSSYTYLSAQRWQPPADAAARDAEVASLGAKIGEPERVYTMGPVSEATARTCPSYDAGKYGLHPPMAYVAQALAKHGGQAGLVRQYAGRDVVYLIGEADTCNRLTWPQGCWDSNLDRGCAGQIQGPHRAGRARLFLQHLREQAAAVSKAGASHGAGDGAGPVEVRHRLSLVSGVGHDNARMFNSREGQTALFGET